MAVMADLNRGVAQSARARERHLDNLTAGETSGVDRNELFASRVAIVRVDGSGKQG